MSQQSSYPLPPYGGGPQDGPRQRSRGPLVLVIALGLVLVATVVVGSIVLLGKSETGSADGKATDGKSAGRASSPESVQFRPVLKAEPNQCDATPTTAPDTTACDDDKTLYTLGPVALDGTHVSEARAVRNEGSLNWVVNLTLDAEGEAAFIKLTTELAAKLLPQNQLAIVVRGRVVSAPTVMSAIPGGKIQITKSDFTKDDADKLVGEITG